MGYIFFFFVLTMEPDDDFLSRIIWPVCMSMQSNTNNREHITCYPEYRNLQGVGSPAQNTVLCCVQARRGPLSNTDHLRHRQIRQDPRIGNADLASVGLGRQI